MIRLAHSCSRTALFGLWILIAATIADAANIDDFMSSAVVIHDDQDVTSGSPQQSPVPHESTATKVPTRHAGRSYVIIDQDSPSLAATDFSGGLTVRATIAVERPRVFLSPFFHESLHIKLRTLII
jgi:hypothetical protein